MLASYYGLFNSHGLSSFVAVMLYYLLIHVIARKICHGEEDETFGRYAILFVLAPFIVGSSWTFEDYFLVGTILCGLTFLLLATFLGRLSLKNTILLTLASPAVLALATVLGKATAGLLD